MKKSILALAVVLVVGLILYPMVGKAQMGPGMMGNWGYGTMGGYGFLSIFFWILIIVGIALLVVWLVLDHALNPMDKGIKLVEVEEKTID